MINREQVLATVLILVTVAMPIVYFLGSGAHWQVFSLLVELKEHPCLGVEGVIKLGDGC